MRALVESILTGDNVEASRLFESRLNSIVEKKLYEKKRMVAADMYESLPSRMSPATIKKYQEIEKRGMTPQKASDVYGDPRDIDINITSKKRKAPPASDLRRGSSGEEMNRAIAASKKRKADDAARQERFASRVGQRLGKGDVRPLARIAAIGAKKKLSSIKGGHDVWMGKKEPTTLKGKGIALVRDIFAGE
jgi:hypothetical protein